MAKPENENLVKLPAEARKELEKLGIEIKKAENGLEVLKGLGMDTRILDDKLKWAKQVRETLLTKFS